MSLINQALRKAQRDRAPKKMPTSDEGADAPAAPVQTSPSHKKQQRITIILLTLVALLIGLVSGLSVVFFNNDTIQSPPVDLTQAAAPDEPDTHAATTPITQKQTPETHSTESADSTPSPIELIAELRKASELTKKAAAPEAASQAPTAKSAKKEIEDAIYNWLHEAKITAVRLSNSGNKMTIDGLVFSEGDTVNYQLGLKCVIIQQTRVLFIDRNGQKYVKLR